ncbi:MAG: ATP-binding protein [Magnetococcus sp. YQC-5]
MWVKLAGLVENYLDNTYFQRKSRDLILLLLLSFSLIQASYFVDKSNFNDLKDANDRYELVLSRLGQLLADMHEVNALSYWFFLNMGNSVVETVHGRDAQMELEKIKNMVDDKLDHMFLDLKVLERETIFRSLATRQLGDDVRGIRQGFDDIFHVVMRMGVDESMGEQGQMRKHAHRMEALLREEYVDPILLASLLELRRREKDFLLRHDSTSLERHRVKIGMFANRLDHSSLGLDVLSEIFEELECYEQRFKTLVVDVIRLDQEMRQFLDVTRQAVDAIRKLSLKAKQESGRQQEKEQNQMMFYSLGFFIAVILVLFVTGLLVHLVFLSVLHPVRMLKDHADRIARGDYAASISLPGQGEIGELARHLQVMKETLRGNVVELEEKVRRRTSHLELTNQVLEETINQLQVVQGQMLQSEKMASLGRLVAGFAHEINTPVGIGVTTISNIPAAVMQLEEMLEQDEVDETELKSCLALIRDSAVLGLSNMRRAADLVTRFKRTSVDQSSESERRFNVMETLQDVVASLHSTFKNSRITIALEGPDDLLVLSHPGSLNQIFTNLLLNSFKHGFEQGQRAGQIHIHCAVEGDSPTHLRFKYRDTGRGIAAADLQKLFEPFFTTARDSGGSGLGMYIVYNIVTGQFKGEIDVSSEPGAGVEFNMHFPVIIIGNNSHPRREMAKVGSESV